MPDTDTTIMWMLQRDVAAVAAIDRLAMGADAWTTATLREALQQARCYGLVLRTGSRITAYALYERQPAELVLLRLVVAPAARRRGYGRQLVAHLRNRLQRADTALQSIDLVVRESTLGAQLFAHATGFRAVRVLRAFYVDTQEDGYWFQLHRRDRADHN